MFRLPEIANPQRKPYPSDLSDAEWEILQPLLPEPKGFGYPVEVDFREILNAIFNVQRTGCQWDMMPHSLPPYSTAYGYFKKWQRKGVWQKKLGRAEDSMVATLAVTAKPRADSQSVKTTEKRGRCADITVARR